MAIKLVTDSTADLTREQVEEYGCAVIPLNVHFGDELYKDGVDLTPEDFFRKLPSSPVMPSTSQPSAGEFVNFYRPFVDEGHTVISVHLSAQLSGTLASAQAAKSMIEGDINLVDSKSASQGAARILSQAARAIANGKSSDEVLDLIDRLIANTHVFFSVDTLEYLQKNGRIGRAAALVGSLLRLKPILCLDKDGFVAPYDKVRGKSRVLPRLLAAVAEKLEEGTAVDLSIMHGNAPEPAAEVYDALAARYKVRDGVITSVGPVIGSHAGPGVVGIAIQPVLEE